MTIDKAISKIQYGLEMETTEMTPFGQLTAVDTDALKTALAILLAQQQAQKNEPLTLEELREMDGEPVWVDGIVFNMDRSYGGLWAIVILEQDEVVFGDRDSLPLKDVVGFAYRHKPEEVKE